MSFRSRYATDKNAEENGVWISLDDGVAVKVARLNNKAARDLRRTLEKPYRNFSSLPENVAEEIMIKVVSQAVVKDWKGVTDEADKALPFSPAAAEKIFKELPDFLNDVVTAAMARETFAAEALDAAKNG